jgi:hypothetical protein
VPFRDPVTTLPADAITGPIQGSQLAADAIDGKTITGATVRTGDATTYPRIEMPPDGNLYFYPAPGMDPAVIKVDGEAGALQFVGPDASGVEYGITVQKAFGTSATTIDTDETNVVGTLTAPNLQSGGFDASFASAASAVIGVSFPTPYPVGTVPSVMTNIASGAGATLRWGSRAINITNAGFQLFLFKGDGPDPVQTWTNIPVQWWAHA